MECQLAKSTFQFSVSNVSQLTGRLYSSSTPTGAIGNVHWRCFVEPHQGNDGTRFLSFGFDIISRQTYISLDRGSDSHPGTTTGQIYSVAGDTEALCVVDVTLTLFNRKRGRQHIRFSRTEHFHGGSKEFAWDRFIEWSRLIDSDSGFLEQDEIEFGVEFGVDSPQSALAKLKLPATSGGAKIESTRIFSSSHRTSSTGTLPRESPKEQTSKTSSSGVATAPPIVQVKKFPYKQSALKHAPGDTTPAQISSTSRTSKNEIPGKESARMESQPAPGDTPPSQIPSNKDTASKNEIPDNESARVDTQFPSTTFLLTIHNVSKLGAKTYSLPSLLWDIQWCCYISPVVTEDGSKFLEVGLKNDSEKKIDGVAILEVMLHNQLGFRHRFNDRRVEHFRSGTEMGWKRFLPWSYLSAGSTAGFVKDDALSLTVCANVLPETIVKRKPSSPDENNNSSSDVADKSQPTETNARVTGAETPADVEIAADPLLQDVSDNQPAAAPHIKDNENSFYKKSDALENNSVCTSAANVVEDADIEPKWITSASKLVDSLHCPVCQKLLEPPVFLCGTGHSICNRCEPHTVICPICSNVYLEKVRNHTVEKLMNFVLFPCDISIECQAKLALNERRMHTAECLYRDVKCVFADCPWRGPLIGFKTHSQSHKTRVIPFANYAGITFKFALSHYEGKDYHKSAHIFTFSGEVFRLRLTKFQGLFFMCIDQFGPVSEAKFAARVVVLSKEAIAAKLSARDQRALSMNKNTESTCKDSQALSDEIPTNEAISSSNHSSPADLSPPTPSNESFDSHCQRSSDKDSSTESIDVSARNLEYECKIHTDVVNVDGKCIPLPPESMLMRNHCDAERKLHVTFCIAKK